MGHRICRVTFACSTAGRSQRALAGSIGAFDLTANELNAALKYGPQFGLALVTDLGSAHPKVFYLWDAARWFGENRLVREPLVWGVRLGPAVI